eukprot:scaffold9751_cov153-Skeletonema_menzelii.AAC.5
MHTPTLEQHRGPLFKSKRRQTTTNQCCGSTSTIIKVVLAISTFVVLFTVPLLHRMVALDSQMPSARDQELNHQFVTVKDDTGGIVAAAAASEDEQRSKRKGEETKTNREATDEVAWEIIPATDATLARLKPATLCTCAKCGSTSMWEELFAIVQGRSFKSMNYTGPPWIHKLSNKKLWTNIHAEKKTDWSNFKNQDSFALIRDPKERIVSAWKSKITCDTYKEIRGHKRLVPKLLELAGSSNITARTDKGFPCLDLSDYLAVLSHIHAQGQEGSLDDHFLPQHLGCFKNAPPSLWTVVTTVSDPTARCSLKSVVTKSANMSNTHDDCQMVKRHGRKIESTNITREDEVMLETITRKEYELLGQYLNV